MAVSPIPAGYAGVTPYLVIRDADRAIGFYQEVFGATEVLRLDGEDGKVAHAELAIGEGFVMLGEEMADGSYRGPLSFGGSPVSLLVYVPDVDAVFERALRAGAETKRPVADQFYGDRSGTIVDPFGHLWTIATHIRDVSKEEMQAAMTESTTEGPSS
jgi:PhnB protein